MNLTKMLATAALTLACLPAHASDPSAKMVAYVQESVMQWIATPDVAAAVRAQNGKTAGLSAEEIDAMDKAWRAEVGSDATPTIDSVMSTQVSQSLSNGVASAQGMITEVFVMDARGLNVASSSVTSDYWQGDEAKYQATYLVGKDAVHVSEIELDESTSSYQSQVSFALTDPATGELIGAVTVGLNAEAFF